MINTKNKTISHENNALRLHPEIVQDGWTLIDCNLAQEEPDTVIFEGVKYLQFVSCNMVRVKRDSTWSAINCNTYNGPKEPEKSAEEMEAELREAERQEMYGRLKSMDAEWLKEKVCVDFKLTATKAVL